MNQNKLFNMIFYALDNQYDLNKDEELGNFLSLMNPFLFKGEESADPSIYQNFKNEYENRFENECNAEEGYYFAKKWLEKQNSKAIIEAFNSVTLKEWIDAVNAIE
jgi:hypothetical protein